MREPAVPRRKPFRCEAPAGRSAPRRGSRGLQGVGAAPLIACILILLAAVRSPAAEFCVSTPAELQAAFDAAETNGQDDVVRIVSGTYPGSFSCSSPLAEAYALTVQGGFGPGCLESTTDPSLTVLDAGGSGVPLFLIAGGYPLEDLTVGNLTVTGGATAGLYAFGGNVDITGCRIVDNHGLDPGVQTYAVGGAWLEATTALRVTGCLVSSNRSFGAAAVGDGSPGGGGIYIPQSAAVEIRNSTFVGNQTLAGYAGALLVNYAGSVLLEGNTFENNLAEYVAGVYLDHCSNLTLRGNLFTGNVNPWTGGLESYFSLDGDIVLEGNVFRNNSGSGGGGARLYSPVRGGAMRITGNTFAGNTSSLLAGGLYLGGAALGGSYSSITVVNNLFAGNGSQSGGGLWINAVEPIVVTNNTFVGNTATQRAGGMQLKAGYSTCRMDVWNNIFRLNTAPLAAEAEIVNRVNLFDLPVDVPLELSHNEYDPAGILVAQPGYVPAPTNIGPLDPLFLDASAGNYRLAAGSPCLDAGSTSAPGLPSTDADGLPRVSGPGVDMGAFERAAAPETVSAPEVPEGPAGVVQGSPATYRAPAASSSLGHILEYEFDWGEGPSGSWTSPDQDHSWGSSGTFAVRARARCSLHPEAASDWSPALAVEAAIFREDFSAGLSRWERLSGRWRIDAGGRLRSSPRKAGRILTAEAAPLLPAAGRLELDVAFGRLWALRPNATVLFAWKDAGNYRYLRLYRGLAGWRALLGQVGDPAGDGSGSGVLGRAALRLPHPRRFHRLRLDLGAGGSVSVRLDGSADPFLAAAFGTAAGGRTGLGAARALVRFDDVLIQDQGVLP